MSEHPDNLEEAKQKILFYICELAALEKKYEEYKVKMTEKVFMHKLLSIIFGFAFLLAFIEEYLV